MITILTTYLVKEQCPTCMDINNCELRKYLATQNLFRPTVNEQLWEPAKSYDEARNEYIAALDTIHAKCKQCKEQAK